MKTASRRPVSIVVADDDPDDRMMLEEAFAENQLNTKLAFVEDGEELIEYLRSEGRYGHRDTRPRVDVVMLDLNMPRMDGREALKVIKSAPDLQRLPVIVLTTSQAEEDIVRTYGLGVSSFITKPGTFGDLVELVRVVGTYWFETVELPSGNAA